MNMFLLYEFIKLYLLMCYVTIYCDTILSLLRGA